MDAKWVASLTPAQRYAYVQSSRLSAHSNFRRKQDQIQACEARCLKDVSSMSAKTLAAKKRFFKAALDDAKKELKQELQNFKPCRL
jgi:hypothetical protein